MCHAVSTAEHVILVVAALRGSTGCAYNQPSRKTVQQQCTRSTCTTVASEQQQARQQLQHAGSGTVKQRLVVFALSSS
jgi:hypothetical protein